MWTHSESSFKFLTRFNVRNLDPLRTSFKLFDTFQFQKYKRIQKFFQVCWLISALEIWTQSENSFKFSTFSTSEIWTHSELLLSFLTRFSVRNMDPFRSSFAFLTRFNVRNLDRFRSSSSFLTRFSFRNMNTFRSSFKFVDSFQRQKSEPIQRVLLSFSIRFSIRNLDTFRTSLSFWTVSMSEIWTHSEVFQVFWLVSASEIWTHSENSFVKFKFFDPFRHQKSAHIQSFF